MPGTWRVTVPSPPSEDREQLVARLWLAGALGVWEQGDELVAWFEERADDELGRFAGAAKWEPEPDHDWQESWKSGLEPVRAGPFLIVPSWLAEEHRPRGDEIRIVLDPGRAFGSGHHATTVMCLEEIGTLGLRGLDVLDVGTGSGILAIAAAKLGANRVVAVDTDPQAVETARSNAELAGVQLDLAVGSVEDVPGGPFRVVVANLLTETLQELRTGLVEGTAPGGTLLVSGVSDDRKGELLASFATTGVGEPQRIRERDGWVAIRWDLPLDVRPAGP